MASVTTSQYTLSQISSMIPPEVKQHWNRIPHKNALAVGVIAGVGLAYFGYQWSTAARLPNPSTPAIATTAPQVIAQPTPAEQLTDAPAERLDPKQQKINELKAMNCTLRGFNETMTYSTLGITNLQINSNENIPVAIIVCWNEKGEVRSLQAIDANTYRHLGTIDMLSQNTPSEGPAKSVNYVMFPNFESQLEIDHDKNKKISEVLLKAWIQLEPKYEGQLTIYLWSSRMIDLRVTQEGDRRGLEENRNKHTKQSMFHREQEMLKSIVNEKRLSLLQEVAENPIGFP